LKAQLSFAVVEVENAFDAFVVVDDPRSPDTSFFVAGVLRLVNSVLGGPFVLECTSRIRLSHISKSILAPFVVVGRGMRDRVSRRLLRYIPGSSLSSVWSSESDMTE
jgi:hypothetical protein